MDSRTVRRTTAVAASLALAATVAALHAAPASALPAVIIPPGCGAWSGQMLPAGWDLEDHSGADTVMAAGGTTRSTAGLVPTPSAARPPRTSSAWAGATATVTAPTGRGGSTAYARRALLALAAALVLVSGLGLGMLLQRPPGADSMVALAASALAPGARGEVAVRDTPSGVELRLDVTGLPAAARGTYYQAWVKSAAGDLVTVGTFHAREGGEDIVLWSAVDPADYPTFTVRLQQEGLGAESSGPVLLSGIFQHAKTPVQAGEPAPGAA